MKTLNLLLWILRDEFPPDIIYAISKFLPKKMKDESKVVVVKYKSEGGGAKEKRKECRYVQQRLNFRKLSF
jgi:hypothetical protein